MLSIFFSSVLLTPIAAAIIAISRKKQFTYNTNKDYQYDLPISAKVQLKNGTLELPANLNEGDTVIAKIRVKSSLSGYWKLPVITVESSKGQWQHPVEHGGRGIRYLNLSHTFSETDKCIKLIAQRLAFSNQEIELSVYPARQLEGKKILVIAPHADDAELSAYGLYETHAQNSFIVTLTASEGGSFHYPNLYNRTQPEEAEAQYLQKGRMRVWNSLTVPLLAKVPSEQILQLGFFDGTLEEMYQHPDMEVKSTKLDTADLNIFRSGNSSEFSKQLTGGSTWHDLVGNLAHIIQVFQPDIIVVPTPNLDAHKDHQMAAMATFDALKKIDYRKGELFLHTLHYIGDDYPIGPSGSMLSLPPKFEHPFYFRSIFSHPLTKEERNRKLLALDAMNDIRPNSDNYLSPQHMLFRGLNTLRHHILHIDKNLISRFVRSNELFYIVPVSDLYNDELYQKISYRAKHYN
ncbi:N-acetylglucosaminylphosphatidylinositol deacetylase [Neisseria arctica]|uniref:N-acetylglucosaminylphosphatidylinositol deacetylase n=1 Tax=Neisseria arctica TaxID=1470200 RepID=A0A0J0YRK1_9NEIS|nr:PIG-L family deacetylase [Neisseria arctica]KLT72756.1 N-acetylglucosaminylphosphatidylinositol deacetylase [Neisseria arctica]UOO87251.1 PIG-L family deacetylase [Neisseria arctica]